MKKKKRNLPKNFEKALGKARRDDEIKQHGKQISFQKNRVFKDRKREFKNNNFETF